MRVPFGSLPDTILETILGAFGVPLGSLGASLCEKMGFGKASKKWSEKRVCKEIRVTLGNPEPGRGNPGFVPINNHSSSPGASRDRWIVDCKTKAPATPHRASGTVADLLYLAKWGV